MRLTSYLFAHKSEVIMGEPTLLRKVYGGASSLME